MYNVTMVCTGNICRSPMAEYQLKEALKNTPHSEQIHVDSAAITSWEIGNPIDQRADAELSNHGITSQSAHHARKYEDSWFNDADLILAMDKSHYDYLTSHAGTKNSYKIRMIRDFSPEFEGTAPGDSLNEKSITDPYYGSTDNFQKVYTQIDQSLPGVIEYITHDLYPTHTPAQNS